MKTDIKSLLLSEMEEYFESIGERAFRAGQVFRWLHGGAAAFGDMTNLPKGLRETLDREFYITAPTILKKQVSQIDGTIKYLWQLQDGRSVESVVMDYEHGHTVCISTQVGCRMGCAFCASAIGGLERNLSASEMEDQAMFSQNDSGKAISNIVLMGIGEPLDNFDNVLRFLKIVGHESGMNKSARRISLSTCGLIENIDKLAEHDIKLTLSVSLHAPDDETRSRLMPINRVTGVDKLFKACHRYFGATGRRVSFEYALIDGVNDSPRQARLLAERLRRSGSHLNLILLNDVREKPLKASAPSSVRAFTGALGQHGVNFTIRRKLGTDIDAACGQLRVPTIQGKGTAGQA